MLFTKKKLTPGTANTNSTTAVPPITHENLLIIAEQSPISADLRPLLSKTCLYKKPLATSALM